uniref:CCHC-type domain-containing protein n=1 Tax=Musa acuminata subsp. malaccensis TaxID=214687 RepID=A0A804ICY1_MUSAM
MGLRIEQFKKLSPPSFSGESDPMVAERWMMQIEKIFDVLNYPDDQKWKLFKEKFNDKYFPNCMREQKELEFLNLIQGIMTVTKHLEEIQEIMGKNKKDKFTSKIKREIEYEASNKRIKTSRFEKSKPLRRTQSCAKCGLNHETSQCFRTTGACFACGKLDHQVRDCPLNRKKPLPTRPSTYARVYAITE